MRFEEELALLLDIRKEGIWIKSEQEKEVTTINSVNFKNSSVVIPRYFAPLYTSNGFNIISCLCIQH